MRPHPFASAAIVAVVLLTLLTTPATAQWQPGGKSAASANGFADGAGNFLGGGTTKVDNAGITLWVQVGTGTFLQAAPDQTGGAHRLFMFGTYSVSRVSAAGTLLWSTTLFSYGGSQIHALASDASGNAYVAWKDRRDLSVQKLWAQKLNSAGVPQWPGEGVLLTAVGVTNTPVLALAADEAGGCYVAWADSRPGVIGPSDLYMQHVTAGGAAWTGDGVAIASDAEIQKEAALSSDGAGGVIVTWMDSRAGAGFDVYAQRVDASGASLWASGGVPLCTAPIDQGFLSQIPDGAGGAFVTWTDYRAIGTSGADIYAQRINSAGTALWTADGTPVCIAAGDQTVSKIAANGSGGILIAWGTTISSTPIVQQLDGTGTPVWIANGVRPVAGVSGGANSVARDDLGGAYVGAGAGVARVLPSGQSAWVPNWRASITAVEDVAGDEGGYVAVSFARSEADGNPSFSPATSGYSVWRKRPGSSSTGNAHAVDPAGLLGPGATMASVASYLTGYTDFPPGTWDAVGYLAALQIPTYSLVVPTHTDSTTAGPADDDFVVIAHTTTTNLYVVSQAGSGHSVDNLPPGIPQNLTGGITGPNSARVAWSPNPEPDLWHYTIYRGTTPDFVPSTANRIGQPVGLSFEDDGFEAGVSHYKVSAFDRHGNESSFALLTPGEITSVPPGTAPTRTYLAPPTPNPSRGEVALEYGNVRGGPVTLVVYDLRGRLVQRLVDEHQAPGVRRALWRGVDERGRRVPSGVYLARLSADGVKENRKIVMSE